MKHLEQYKQFENEFHTKLEQFKGGIRWELNNNTYIIKTEALGVYKHHKVDMYKVLKNVSFKKGMNGSVEKALWLVKRLKKAEEFNKLKEIEK